MYIIIIIIIITSPLNTYDAYFYFCWCLNLIIILKKIRH
jgi:hypothetical protein